MADFSTPVRIPRAAFDQIIVRIDDAVGEHGVALILHEDYPFRNLDPVTSTAVDFSEIELQDDPLDLVENLDQLLYFAFELASPRTVASWISEYDPNLEKEAVERVEVIRNRMPNLAKLWRAKNYSITAPLVEFNYDVVDADDTNEAYVNLYLAAARIDSSDGAPDKSDISRLRVQLWPSDVRILVREFAHLWHAHLSNEQGDDGKVDSNGDQTDS